MKVLVTGAGGFVGGHLLRLLVEHGHEVNTLGQGAPRSFSDSACHVELDILDKEAVAAAMYKFEPEAVIHLAALSSVPYSWQDPGKAISVNVCGMINVLEAFARVRKGNGIFLSIGSGEEYGLAAKAGHFLSEDDVCMPQNPYAVSKLCAEQLALRIGERLGIKVIHTRSFNHFGPGQALNFVISNFANQIAEIEAGKKEPVLYVGGLSTVRDFTYVVDVVKAYVALLENNVSVGTYNVCSGKARQIQQVLAGLLDLAKVDVEVREDPARLRSSEVPVFVGDNSKIHKATGWEPQVSFARGLAETIAYWRRQQ